MKKILATVLGVVFAMFAFAGCNMAAADGTATGASGVTSIVMMVVIIAVFYFLMIVPEKKRKKKAQEMRDSIEVGDKIVTIGGMVSCFITPSVAKKTGRPKQIILVLGLIGAVFVEVLERVLEDLQSDGIGLRLLGYPEIRRQIAQRAVPAQQHRAEGVHR